MATVINVKVYKINSNNIIPGLYGVDMAFGAASIVAQPVTGSTLAERQGGTPVLLYSALTSSATGSTVFYSPLTVAQIVTAANA